MVLKGFHLPAYLFFSSSLIIIKYSFECPSVKLKKLKLFLTKILGWVYVFPFKLRALILYILTNIQAMFSTSKGTSKLVCNL